MSIVSTPVPTKVAGLATRAVELALANQGDVSGVLTEDGTVWSWGHNAQGAHGYDPAGDPICGTSRCNFTPRVLLDDAGAPFSGVTRLAIGRSTSCLLKEGGVWCWGGNGLGTAGAGAGGGAPRLTPVRVPGLGDVRSMALADFVVVATDGSGTSWAWGRNNFGAVGDGTVEALGNGCQQACRPAPTELDVPALTQVSVSGTVLALDARGTLWMWGENAGAQLGHLPGELGDRMCGTGAQTPAPCNPTPMSVEWLP
jgi:alpha-tubulin suppressor-like RCC1 family protein